MTTPFSAPGSRTRAYIPRSALAGVLSPALPDRDGALSLALQFQLDTTERWPPGILREHQLIQIRLLLEHAFRTAPFWREHLARADYRSGMEITPQWFASLPTVTRTQAQSAGAGLFSTAVPPQHGNVYSTPTSGSTATPMICRSTDLTRLFWGAFTLRDTMWHERDLAAKLAAIRVGYERGTHETWGSLSYCAFQTGQGVTLDARDNIETQIAWLMSERPAYLLTHASNLRALAAQFLERGLTLDSLREVKSFSEALPADLRELAREAWGVELVDMYSTNEVGYVALQCPQFKHYHVQSEGVLVEILDESGAPCAGGEIGRVVVTSLHNYAMPFVRYELDDYAEVGAPCPCGRGLPVLNRILGRTRNMLRLPGGHSFWPGFPLRALTTVAPIRQFRLIQHSLTAIELQMVVDRPLSGGEEESLRAALYVRLRHPFDIRLTRVDQIERGPNYKFEDFICKVT